jgi:hypothetical protein
VTTPGDGEPADPHGGQLDAGAIIAHELYRSLRRAGFGRWEALWLTAAIQKDVPLPSWFADKLESMKPDEEEST